MGCSGKNNTNECCYVKYVEHLLKILADRRKDLLWWCSSGAAVWVRIVVPHGRVYLALAQLAQQAHTRDVQGDDVNSNSN